ncbi:MAG: BolA/IbaG family iron-sulfur metabolism protein [Gammaproteobacteria bacterium]|nr:BolA/IbaG family iron-sulfur metabolism protein [Gammaproteobacteria bacterium]
MNIYPIDLSDEIKKRIEATIPHADVNVRLASNRHYEICVISTSFNELSQVKRHQKVYAAITDLMSGDDAPVHAIDKLDTRLS